MVAKQPKAGSTKPKFLLDEGLPPRRVLKTCNQTWDIKHIRDDYGLGGATDRTVYDLANSEGRILITFNVKDFKKLQNKEHLSIIAISPNIPTEKLDSLIKKQAMSLSPSNLHGKIIKVTVPN
jgi:predicted nuclease of predicted toxin-antitoxin system